MIEIGTVECLLGCFVVVVMMVHVHCCCWRGEHVHPFHVY